MPAKLHPLEWLPLAFYLLFLLIIGFRSSSSGQSLEGYLLAGRKLTLPAFVATLVTTWYGGILGVGEFTYLYGLSNWVVFGLPYYVFALLFAFFLAPTIRQAAQVSIPDQLFRHYNRPVGFLGAVFTLFMTLPAAYVLMTALLLQWITGWSLALCAAAATLFSTIYVLNGGFRAVVRTDKFQFVLMYGGFLVLAVVLMSRYGGLGFLKSHLPSLHLSWSGGNPLSFILVWYLIALWTFVDPGFHQRCYAAATPAVAQKGILVSILFWFLFDVLTTLCGLYARALLPDITPALSYPELGHRVLGPLGSGLFLTALAATIMSTVDSLAFLSAITVGHDILARLPIVRFKEQRLVQVGLVFSMVASIAVALLLPSVIQIWYTVGSLFIPPLLLPVTACYYPKFQIGARFTLANLILAFAASAGSFVMGVVQSSSLNRLVFPGNLPPMYPGLAVSLAIYGAGWLKKAVFLQRSDPFG